MDSARLAFVDNVKAIAMLLVLLGHAPGLNQFLMNVIYAFHMPVFFFISGLLLTEKKTALPLHAFVFAQLRGLGLPFLFFFSVSYLYWLPTHHLAGSAQRVGQVSWWTPLLGLLVGSQWAWLVNAVLWFFMCLFMTAIIFFVARKYFSAKFLFLFFNILGVAFTLLYNASWPRWPWSLDSAVLALGFYSAGHYFRARPLFATPRRSARALILSVVLGFALLLGTYFNGKVDLNLLDLGRLHWAYFLNAYLGIFALLFFSFWIAPLHILRWIAAHTIIIFPSHLLFYSAFTGFAVVVLHWPYQFKESSWLWTVLFPIAALILSYPLALILKHCCPYIFGKRNAPENISTTVTQSSVSV